MRLSPCARRTILVPLLFAVCGPVVGRLPAAQPAQAAAEPKPPNVVYIISDDQAWTDFGFMGHETIQTPCLDKLAAQAHDLPPATCPRRSADLP